LHRVPRRICAYARGFLVRQVAAHAPRRRLAAPAENPGPGGRVHLFYFSDEGFHVVDPASQSRRRWSELAGYLEDRHIYLLYLNPRLYRIVPKRALGHRLDEFGRLVQTALPPFDYRRPVPVADTARI